MDPFVGAALASAGGNLLSSSFGIKASRNAEDRAYQRSLQMQDRQNAFNVDMWNKANAYNAPAHQIQLMKEAGLNPAMFTPGASQASEVTASDASVPQNSELGQLYKGLNPASDVITALQTDAQIQKLRTDIKYQKLVNRDLENQILAKEIPFDSGVLDDEDDPRWSANAYYRDEAHKSTMQKYERSSARSNARLSTDQQEVYHNTKSFLQRMPEQQLRALQEDVNSKVMNNSILGREVEIMRKYGISPNDKDGLLSLLKVALTDPEAFNKIIDAVSGVIPSVIGSNYAPVGRGLQTIYNHIKGYGNSHFNPRR